MGRWLSEWLEAGRSGPHGPQEDFGFYSKCRWKSLVSSERGSGVVWLTCGEQSLGRRRGEDRISCWIECEDGRKGEINDKFKALGLSKQMNGQSGLLEAKSCQRNLADLSFIPLGSLCCCLVQTPITPHWASCRDRPSLPINSTVKG